MIEMSVHICSGPSQYDTSQTS